MTLDDLMDYYGTIYKVSKGLGLSPSSAYHWWRLGYVPIETQIRIQEKTNGALVADINHCTKASNNVG